MIVQERCNHNDFDIRCIHCKSHFQYTHVHTNIFYTIGVFGSGMTLLIATSVGVSQRNANLPASKAMTFKNNLKVLNDIK